MNRDMDEKRLIDHVFAAQSEGMGERVLHQACRTLLDGLSCIAAGRFQGYDEPSVRKVLEGGQCTAMGLNKGYSAPSVAYYHASCAQMHDFNDGLITSGEFGGSYHPGRVIIPVALACGELVRASGVDLLMAISLGYDIAYSLRWEQNSPPGPPRPDACAATLVAGKLLKLDFQQLRNAMSLAEFLSPIKLPKVGYDASANHLCYGLIARSAIECAVFARNGISGFGSSFSKTLSKDIRNSDHDGYALSKVYFKPYPTCRVSHAAIEVVLEQRTKYHFTGDQIRRIYVSVPPRNIYIDKVTDTKSSVKSCEYSMQYALACAVLDGAVTLDQFSEHEIKREVRHIFGSNKVKVLKNEKSDLESRKSLDYYSVRIELNDGQIIEEEKTTVYGNPDNPMGDDFLIDKFLRNAKGYLPFASTVPSFVFEKLVESENVCELTQLLSGN